ncbi:MAG: CPBP family intramembrane metalloprotease [Pedosphaera sp.]|nr:CPBP family intramembrane metalloprotease [Pedosphaera sp.]
MNPDIDLPSPQHSVPPLLNEGPPLAEQPYRPRWRSWVFLIVVGFYPLLISLLGSIVDSGQESRKAALPSDVWGLTLASLQNFGIFAALFATASFFGRPTRAELFWAPMRWIDWLRGLLWSVGVRLIILVLLLAVLMPIIAAQMILRGNTGPEASKQVEAQMQEYRPKVEALVDLQALANPLYLLVACTLLSFITAGLREELWRSGFMAAVTDLLPDSWKDTRLRKPSETALKHWFRRGRSKGVAVGLASIIFGLGHLLQGPGAVVLTGVVGLILGLVMLGHRSLWTAVIAHGFFDTTTFFLLGLLVRYRESIEKLAPGLFKQLGL